MSDPQSPPPTPPAPYPVAYGQPSPYAPHPGYASPTYALDQLLAPARRAGVMMFIVSVLGVLLGGSFLLGSSVATSEEFRSNPQVTQAMSQAGITLKQMQLGLVVVGVLLAVASVAIGVTAFFVRRGGVGALVVGMVLTVLPMLLFVLFGVGGLLAGQPSALCVYGPLSVILGVIAALLAHALTKSGQVKQWRNYLASAPAYGWPPQPGPYSAAGSYPPVGSYPQAGPYPPNQPYSPQNYPPLPPPNPPRQ